MNIKVGCITWWRNNYGSILQAYALQKVVKERYSIEYEIINQYSKKTTSIENLLNKIRTIGFTHTFKRLLTRYGFRGLRNRVINIQKYIDNRLEVSSNVYNEQNYDSLNANYNVFICGSDQIWNPANVSVNDKLYWLEFVDKQNKKIAYAPSIGITTIDQLSAQKIVKHLSTFDAISCREDSGTRFINSLLKNKKCKTVVDPTLLLLPEEWDQEVSENKIEGPYIFSYILRGTKKDRKWIENYAKDQNLQLVTIPFLDAENPVLYDMKFGDIKIWDASPSDFLTLIKNAEYIFTDSFHCMIFSILFHKRFFVFRKLGSNQMERIKGIQDLLGTGNRIINNETELQEIKKMNDICWKNVDQKREKLRDISLAYLDKVFEFVEENQ